MSDSKKNTVIKNIFLDKRLLGAIVFFSFLAFLLLFKLIFSQIVEAEQYRDLALNTRTVSYKTTAKRGSIFDRNGNVLAYSVDTVTISANPNKISNKSQVSNEIFECIGGNAQEYFDLLNQDSTFVYIKHNCDTEQSSNLKNKKIDGIYFDDDQKRIYPYGVNAGQIIGAVNIDGDGICGLELYYNEVLKGTSGNTITQQGAGGMQIPGATIQKSDSSDGQDIMLTIDIELQQKVEEYLTSYRSKVSAKSGHATVADPQTGEIYACASLPLFDPNNISNAESGSTELKDVSSTYEPGSTFKIVSAMAALENNTFKPDDVIFCPYQLKAYEYSIKDAFDRGDASMSFKEIIARSSNVGISLIVEKLGFEKLYEKILKYNLNNKTNIDFPGDTTGYLTEPSEWSKIQAYNISFGQGITLTPMQLMRFFCSIANNGVEPTPHFLLKYLQSSNDVDYPSTDVVENKQAIPSLIQMMRGVVDSESGTGTKARINGYGVAGKTGTAQIADGSGRYISGKYYSSFIGFLSTASTPLICSCSMDVVENGSVTELFHQIMTFAISRYQITPKG